MTPLRLAHETLLAGHLLDRAAMPLLLAQPPLPGYTPLDEMRDVAVEEWSAASPVYTRRMQRLLGFAGDDVTTIFKGMQLDIGAPPQFMDFRYTVHDRNHGEFHLDHCGALVDVEPMGDEFVVTMCHAIEDPTFPATACATNPRARVEPVHRPPRVPADRHPHCHWTVTIEGDATPAAEPAAAVTLATSLAARMPLPDIHPDTAHGGGTGPGLYDYSGELLADGPLEALAPSALAAVTEEAALQGHLLALGYWIAVAERRGEVVARELAGRTWGAVGAVVAGRLASALDLPTDLDLIAGVLSVHPALRPYDYTGVEVQRRPDAVTVTFHPAPAHDEVIAQSGPALLATGPDEAGRDPLAVLCQGVDPRSRLGWASNPEGVVAAAEVTLGEEATPEPDDVALVRFSSGADFRFALSARA